MSIGWIVRRRNDPGRNGIAITSNMHSTTLILYALLFASFFFLSNLSSLVDKILFSINIVAILILAALGRLKPNRMEATFITICTAYFITAIISAFSTGAPFGFHSFTGLYELWRAHISLLLGFILSRHISQKLKNNILSGLMIALKFNILFTLLQAISGDYLIQAMLTLSQFPDETVEYRSGIVRTVGFFTNANVNAWFIALYLHFLLSHLKLKKTWVILTLAALFSTGSRTVIFTSLLLIVFQFSTNNGISIFNLLKKHLWVALLLITTVIFLESLNEKSTAVGYSLIPDIEVLTSVKDGKVEDSYFRAYALKTSIERFLESPLLGLGPGNYGTPSSFRSHSRYLSEDGYDFFIDRGMTQLDLLIPLLLPETGILGLIAWATLMIYLLNRINVEKSHSPRMQIVYWWCLLMIINAFIGPGITHPLVVAIIPIVVFCSAHRQNETLSPLPNFENERSSH